jgi:hypothetical protein
MIVYNISPIDNWFGWMHWETLIANASKPRPDLSEWHPDGDDRNWSDQCPDEKVLRDTLTRAQRLARRIGWEGDCSLARAGELLVICVPAGLEARQ